jgi:hypothetical protein
MTYLLPADLSPVPTDTHLLKTPIFLPIFTTYPLIAIEIFTLFSPLLQLVAPTSSHPTNVFFLAGTVVVMAPKSKQAEGEEN